MVVAKLEKEGDFHIGKHKSLTSVMSLYELLVLGQMSKNMKIRQI
jgi:hypothetical protein